MAEYIHVVEAPAEPEQVLANQQQPPVPDDTADLERLAAHLAEYESSQLLMRVAAILAEETDVQPQVQPLSAGAIELSGAGQLPEIWRIEGQTATIEQRQVDGQQRPVERSLYFPFLAAVNLFQLLFPCNRAAEESALKSFRDWVRKKVGQREEDEPTS